MLLEYSIYLSEDSCRIMPWISLCSFVYSSGLTPVSYSIQMSKFLAQLSFRIMRDGNLSSVKFRIKDKMRLQNLSNSQYGALVYLQRSILGMRKEIFSESFHFRISSCLPVKWSGEPCQSLGLSNKNGVLDKIWKDSLNQLSVSPFFLLPQACSRLHPPGSCEESRWCLETQTLQIWTRPWPPTLALH